MRCIERAFDVSAVVEATHDDCCRNGIVLTPAAAEAAATDDEVVSRELLEPTAAGCTESVFCSSLLLISGGLEPMPAVQRNKLRVLPLTEFELWGCSSCGPAE